MLELHSLFVIHGKYICNKELSASITASPLSALKIIGVAPTRFHLVYHKLINLPAASCEVSKEGHCL